MAGEAPPAFPGKSSSSAYGSAFGEGGGEGGGKRNIPKDFEFSPKSLKPLARLMLSMSISLGHACTAYREFVRLKSATISPDGMLGGRGYVLQVKDIRGKIQQACEELSAVSDTIHDEINAAHWKPKLAQLPPEELHDVTNLLEDSKKILDDPEGFGEKELDDIENETDTDRDERFHAPGPPKDEDLGSKVPNGGDSEYVQHSDPNHSRLKSAAVETLEQKIAARFLRGNSSLPVQTLPGGPRVQHLDRGDSDQTGPYGSYNSDETLPTGDQWGRDQGVGGEYNYPSAWDGDNSKTSDGGLPQWGASATPDAQLDTSGTETDADDFGLGYGAKGKGSGGYANPSAEGKGVWGPAAGLPGSGLGQVTDGDSTPMVEQSHKTTYASYEESSVSRLTPTADSELPNDDQEPVARSDYYRGDRGNQFNVSLGESGLPGQGPKGKLTPQVPRPMHNNEHMFATDSLPGDGTDARDDHDRDLGSGVGQDSEDLAVPYVKRDWDTHNDRHDQQDLYNYDRTPNG